MPISPTHRRPQLFDATHPNFGGYMGIRVPPALIGEMKRADLMVALGERMTDTVSQSYSFPTAPQPQLPLVHIWPDPNEVGRVWRPDLGMPCSPHEVIKALLRRGAPADAGKRRGWVDGLHAIHRKLLAKEWEPTTRRRQFRRHRLRGRQASGARCDRHHRRRQFRQLCPSLYRLPPGAGFSLLGRRRDGFGHADGGRGGIAPAGHAGRRLSRRRRRIDDGQRDRHRRANTAPTRS